MTSKLTQGVKYFDANQAESTENAVTPKPTRQVIIPTGDKKMSRRDAGYLNKK
jgi:hypothetical protein